MIDYEAKMIIKDALSNIIKLIHEGVVPLDGDTKAITDNALREVDLLRTDHTCHACEYWNNDKGGCDKFQATPPYAFQMDGCSEWKVIASTQWDDDLPF